jgi:hypothetical protein
MILTILAGYPIRLAENVLARSQQQRMVLKPRGSKLVRLIVSRVTSQLIRNPDREWTVHGPIRGTDVNGCYYVDPGIQDEYKHCLKALQRRQFVLLAGARASGKTTRLFRLKRELEAKGYQVI